MAGRRGSHEKLRELHGPDVEFVEVSPSGDRTGRRFEMVQRDPVAWIPWWLRISVLILGTVVGVAALVFCGWCIVFGLGLIWSVFRGG